MTPEAITKLAPKFGLGKHAANLVELMRPALLLTPSRTEIEKIPLGASRIGGVPDLSQNRPWPTREGRPLSFIAQINLAEAARFAAARDLPSTGSLAFFYDSEKDPWGFKPEHHDCFAMVHDTGAFLRATTPEGLDEEHQYRPCSIAFEEIWTAPPEESATFSSMGLSRDERDMWSELRDEVGQKGEWAARSLLLGYPDQIQGDMESRCATLRGLKLDAPRTKAQEAQIKSEARDWRLLLQVSSEPEAEMGWGDDGCLYYWVRASDLSQGRFDQGWLHLQCS